MSRLARNPVVFADSISCVLNGSELTIKGPQGSISIDIPSFLNIDLNVDKKSIALSMDDKYKRKHFPMLGTIRAKIVSYIKGVTTPYKKTLELSGTGYKAFMNDDGVLEMALAYSHPIKHVIKSSVKVTCSKQFIEITGIRSEDVGQVAAEIESYRVPTPYKGGKILGNRIVTPKAGKK